VVNLNCVRAGSQVVTACGAGNERTQRATSRGTGRVITRNCRKVTREEPEPCFTQRSVVGQTGVNRNRR